MTETQVATADTGRPRRKADPYTIFWQTDDGLEVVTEILSDLGTWLREKGIDEDLSRDVHRRGEGIRFLCMHHRSDWKHELQARLVEEKANGIWTTELTVSATEKSGGWARLSVTCSEDEFVGTPRVAKYMLQSGRFRDGGSLALTPTPKYVSVRDVEDLAAVLTDVDRQGLVLVAGSSDDVPFDQWSKQVARWTRDVTGLAETFVLDPPATAELAEVLGEEYATKPFTLRTYKPGVDPALPEGARRHRYLSTKRLVESSVGGIAHLLGRIAREHNAARPLPDSVRSTFRAFRRIESRLLAQSVLEEATQIVAGPDVDVSMPEPIAPPSSVDVDSLMAQVEEYTKTLGLVQRVLGVEVLTEENLARFTKRSTDAELLALFESELESKLTESEELADQLAQVRDALEDAQLELDDEAEARSKAEDEARWLREQLKSIERWDVAHSQIPQDAVTQYPDSFEELVVRLLGGELEGVVFTGDRACAEELDTHDGLDTAVRGAWDACLALRDYVRYRLEGHNCDVFHYLRQAPSGYRVVSGNKHAAKESESVMKNGKWANERCLPVPPEVDPSREVMMFAHFKCALVGMVSPRLHYYDDVARTGKVYIGYIGRHLTNKGTN